MENIKTRIRHAIAEKDALEPLAQGIFCMSNALDLLEEQSIDMSKRIQLLNESWQTLYELYQATRQELKGKTVQ